VSSASSQALLSELEKLLNGILYLGELSPRSRDLLVSYGERMSVRLVAAQLNNLGVPSKAFDSWELGLRTTSNFGGAEVLPSSYDYIRETMAAEMKAHRNGSGGGGREEMEGELVAVVTGFIAHDERGRVTTLGRGGSDLTAAVLGAACGLDEIQVWKDVDGMLTADPRVVQTAVPVPSVTFVEASELAYFGAKILHPISMQPAAAYNIPVRIKNSYNPDHPGTVIKDVVTDRGDDHLVTAITTKSDQTLIDSTSLLSIFF
jgi:aspartate kinase